MSDMELGFYWRCLNQSWMNEGLPSDLGELARTLRVTKSYLARVWVRVGRCFVDIDGRLVNSRQERERAAASGTSDSRSAAAKKRWNAIASGLNVQSDATRDRAPSGSGSDSSGVVGFSEEIKPAVEKFPPGYTLDEHYEQFRNVAAPLGWIAADFTEAWYEWKLLDFEQRTAAIEGLKARIAVELDPQMIPRPKRFLNKREWTRRTPGKSKKTDGNDWASLAAL